jgi:hypothetical protein
MASGIMDYEKFMWKKIIITLLSIVGLSAVGIILIGALMVFTVPRSNDVETSKLVYNDFVQSAKTNLPPNRLVHFNYSAKRGLTWIIVSGNLSQEEEHTLTAIADGIQTNYNRRVQIMFAHGQ